MSQMIEMTFHFNSLSDQDFGEKKGLFPLIQPFSWSGSGYTMFQENQLMMPLLFFSFLDHEMPTGCLHIKSPERQHIKTSGKA